MKIAIYANELNKSSETGVKIYTKEIIKALVQADHVNEYGIFLQNGPGLDLARKLINDKRNFEMISDDSVLPFWTYVKFPNLLKKYKPDALFMPIQTVPYLFKPRGMKIITTIHDVAFLLFKDCFTKEKSFLLDIFTRNASRLSDSIIVPSNATKNDVEKYYGMAKDKITVVYHGVAGSDMAVLDEMSLKKIRSLQPYILFVGSIQPRKNLVSLITAFNKMKSERKSDLRLVICGPKGWMYEQTFEAAKGGKFCNDIIFTGNVEGNYLKELYGNALFFVMPSLYEGFGLPVIEAMKSGLPCVVSDNSSLSEISGGAALLFDPKDISDIAKKMRILFDDQKLREEYSKKSKKRSLLFDWNKAAKTHMKVFEK